MTPYKQQDPKSIVHLFSTIAHRYDLGNSLMSMNFHKWWNKSLALSISNHVAENGVYLDMCSGTGDIAHKVLDSGALPEKVIFLDFCKEMLEVAKIKAKQKKISIPLEFLVEDAQATSLKDSSIDAITIAYGIRNVKSIDTLFSEMYRLLKPGGVVAILELTRPTMPVIKQAHQLYLKTYLPLAGKLLTNNKKAYNYLAQSIQTFTEPKQIISALNKAGFSQTISKEKTLGIATLITCKKK